MKKNDSTGAGPSILNNVEKTGYTFLKKHCNDLIEVLNEGAIDRLEDALYEFSDYRMINGLWRLTSDELPAKRGYYLTYNKEYPNEGKIMMMYYEPIRQKWFRNEDVNEYHPKYWCTLPLTPNEDF